MSATSSGPVSGEPGSGRPCPDSRDERGANGPSKAATWLYAASGSTPAIAGYLAFSLSWLANRRAATPLSTEVPQTIGSVPTRSRASDLPGLTNDSLAGRHWWDTSSRRLAASSYTSGPIRVTPRPSAITSSGTASAHSIDRGSASSGGDDPAGLAACGGGPVPPRSWPAGTTGINGARACSAIRCSGDPAVPTPASRQPRLAASVAMASVSGVVPEQDTAMTASAAPTQPGSRSA